MTQAKVTRALLSVFDKSGLVPLGQVLARHGVQLISTGGTYRALADAGLSVTEVAQVTGFPEMMDGRVKTLHPRIHGGLLGRVGTDDAVMATHGIEPIDVVVVNLYPFAQTVAKPGVTFAEAIEQIDIGGPAMLRSGAKNHARVCVVTDPADYDELAAQLDVGAGTLTEAFRRRMAAKVYRATSDYDGMIADYLAQQVQP